MYPSKINFLAVCLILLPVVLGAAYKPVVEKGTVETPDFGEAWREIVWEDDGSVMVLVPGGTYRIGTEDETLPGFQRREGPVVDVTIGSFYIDKFETEMSRYRTVAAKEGLEPPRLGVRNLDELAGQPVRAVSWNAAQQYARIVRKDLPTEAEWEIAGRGRALNLFPWGNEPKEGAVIGRGVVGEPEERGASEIDVSEFGVHDLAGNVSEWMKDGYVRDYCTQVAGSKNPYLDSNKESRTIRGGNFYLEGGGRLTVREPHVTNSGREEVGFRTVFRLQEKPEATPTPTPAPPTPTPTPSANVRIDAMRQRIQPHLADPEQPIPYNIAGVADTTWNMPIFNQTPHAMRVGIASIESGEIFTIRKAPLAPCSIALVEIPEELLVCAFVYPTDIENAQPVYIGQVNSASNPLLVLEPNTFNRVVTPAGETMDPGTEVMAKQVYPGEYRALWNRYQVLNSTGMPVEVFAGPEQDDKGIREQWRLLLENGESAFIISESAGKMRMAAKYVGASDPVTSEVEPFFLDDSADHRVFVLGRSAGSETIRVLTTRLPEISIEQHEGSLPASVRGSYLSQ